MEELETRIAPALDPLQVTICADDPVNPIPQNVTLRDALAYADGNPGSTITWKPGVSGTISLERALPDISANTTIAGPGSTVITVSAANAQDSCRIFTVDGGVTAQIDSLEIGGNNNTSLNGGAILNKGNLTLEADHIGSVTSGNGGGIYNSADAKLTMSGDQIVGNRANQGGGLYNAFGTITIIGSTINSNTASKGGGGIYNLSGTVTAEQGTTFNGNSDGVAGGGVGNAGTFIIHGGQISNNFVRKKVRKKVSGTFFLYRKRFLIPFLNLF